ncbi:MAG: leucine-rich repeat protein [Ruminococcus callidus]
MTQINSYAFSSKSKLLKVTIPDSVTSIGNAVFSSCAHEKCDYGRQC